MGRQDPSVEKECNKRLTQKLVKPVAKHKHKKGENLHKIKKNHYKNKIITRTSEETKRCFIL